MKNRATSTMQVFCPITTKPHRADHRADTLERVKVKGMSNARWAGGPRRTSDLHSFEFSAAAQTATDLVHNVPDAEAHGYFD